MLPLPLSHTEGYWRVLVLSLRGSESARKSPEKGNNSLPSSALQPK